MIDKNRVFKIAYKMSNEGLNNNFIKNMVNLSFEYEGCYDLMELWYEETDEVELINLIEDMKDMIEDCKGDR